ncbi:MAG: hypothetical protein JSW47_01335 [Phycisphaerales bacterium]|nr:MAG: hypothetical protein JSW47_01335 [Phycisphaerales bacterium]
MPEKVVIKAGNEIVQAELNDGATAQAILAALDIRGRAQRWGGEIYFSIPVGCELEEGSRDVLEAGELAYWPPGRAFCIFFGPTPASQGDEIRAASAVNIVGKITGDFSSLWDVPDGAPVSIEKA